MDPMERKRHAIAMEELLGQLKESLAQSLQAYEKVNELFQQLLEADRELEARYSVYNAGVPGSAAPVMETQQEEEARREAQGSREEELEAEARLQQEEREKQSRTQAAPCKFTR